MKIAFAGLRHVHIFVLADLVRAHPSVEIQGWWEEDTQAAQEAQKRFEEPAYESYQALLNDPEVDAVAIGDYYGIRGQRIIQALQAGKHVLADKPLCTSLSELETIRQLCREKNLKIGCMLDLRYDPALRLAAQLVRSGQLGTIHALSFNGQHPLSWGTRPMWYFEEGKHGGTFNDLAIHGLDAVEMITGLKYEQTLCARQWNAFAKQAPQFCDCAQLMGTLENGAGLMADVSYSAPNLAAFTLETYWRFTIWGEQGYLECRFGENAVTTASAADAAAHVLPAPPVTDTCLTDFLLDIQGMPSCFDTQSVLRASENALNLQQFANHTGKDE